MKNEISDTNTKDLSVKLDSQFDTQKKPGYRQNFTFHLPANPKDTSHIQRQCTTRRSYWRSSIHVFDH